MLIDAHKQCRFYLAFDHFSHVIELAGPAEGLLSFGTRVIIKSDRAFFLADSSGTVVAEKTFNANLSFIDSVADQFIVCGTEAGLICIFDPSPDTVFSYKLDAAITAVSYNKNLETIFAGTADDSIVVLQRRTGQMTRTSLTGRPVLITGHEAGAVVGTNLDQLGLLNNSGQILARYTLPFKLRRLLPCHRRLCMIVLADESVSCLAAVENNNGSSTGQQHET
jgi:hypothetical protein